MRPGDSFSKASSAGTGALQASTVHCLSEAAQPAMLLPADLALRPSQDQPSVAPLQAAASITPANFTGQTWPLVTSHAPPVCQKQRCSSQQLGPVLARAASPTAQGRQLCSGTCSKEGPALMGVTLLNCRLPSLRMWWTSLTTSEQRTPQILYGKLLPGAAGSAVAHAQ